MMRADKRPAGTRSLPHDGQLGVLIPKSIKNFVGLIFAIIGGDFPYELLILWGALVFLFGFLSATAIDTFERLLGSRERKSQFQI